MASAGWPSRPGQQASHPPRPGHQRTDRARHLGEPARVCPPAPGCRVSCRPVLTGDAVFVPNEIPRRGVLALWGTGSGTGKVELVFARGTDALRKRLVTARFLSVAEALPELLSIDPNAAGLNGAGLNGAGL